MADHVEEHQQCENCGGEHQPCEARQAYLEAFARLEQYRKSGLDTPVESNAFESIIQDITKSLRDCCITVDERLKCLEVLVSAKEVKTESKWNQLLCQEILHVACQLDRNKNELKLTTHRGYMEKLKALTEKVNKEGLPSQLKSNTEISKHQKTSLRGILRTVYKKCKYTYIDFREGKIEKRRPIRHWLPEWDTIPKPALFFLICGIVAFGAFFVSTKISSIIFPMINFFIIPSAPSDEEVNDRREIAIKIDDSGHEALDELGRYLEAYFTEYNLFHVLDNVPAKKDRQEDRVYYFVDVEVTGESQKYPGNWQYLIKVTKPTDAGYKSKIPEDCISIPTRYPIGSKNKQDLTYMFKDLDRIILEGIFKFRVPAGTARYVSESGRLELDIGSLHGVRIGQVYDVWYNMDKKHCQAKIDMIDPYLATTKIVDKNESTDPSDKPHETDDDMPGRLKVKWAGYGY